MKNKKILIPIIVVLVLILICGGAFAYVYFATDLLKTNKELFAKNAQTTTANLKQFLKDENVVNYFSKKLYTPYENEGNISAKTDSGYSSVNINALSIDGAVDMANQKVEQNVKLNYSNTVNLPISYVQNGDKYAITSSEILNKYLTLDNNNLKQFATKLGIDSENIPNKLEMPSKTTNYQQILQKYIDVITSNLTDDNFSKDTSTEQENYTVKISNEQLKNIIIAELNLLKLDNDIMDMSNIGEEDYVAEIDEAIEDAESADFTDEYISVTVYKVAEKQGKMVIDSNAVTCEINLSADMLSVKLKPKNTDEVESLTELEELEFSIQKTVNADSSKYTITAQTNINGKTTSIAIDALIDGMTTDNSQENYSVTITSNETEISATFVNKVTFKDSVSITELTNSNSELINNYSATDLQNIMQAIVVQFISVNNQKLQQVGTDASGIGQLFM